MTLELWESGERHSPLGSPWTAYGGMGFLGTWRKSSLLLWDSGSDAA